MLTYYTQPLLQGLVFVIGIYIEKFIRRTLYPKAKHPHDKQWKLKWRVGMMLVVTVMLMTYNYYSKCVPFGISPSQCFYLTRPQQYLASFIVSILSPFIANILLFSYHLYERIKIKQNLTFERLKQTKAIFWAPILEQMLFRASFYRASEEKVSIFYLSLIFSLAHFHRLIWKKVLHKKNYPVNQTITQSVFTFIFGLYSFYFLSIYHSIISSIVLHCMCNFFGPPSINLNNLKFHIVAILMFAFYLVFLVSD